MGWEGDCDVDRFGIDIDAFLGVHIYVIRGHGWGDEWNFGGGALHFISGV